MTLRLQPLVFLTGRLLVCALVWGGGTVKTVAQVSVTPGGAEALVQLDPHAPDNGANVRRAAEADDAFCAQLWLLGERGFFAEAQKGHGLPAFAPVRVAPRNRAFFAAVFFGNAAVAGVVAPDPRVGMMTNVSYDIAVHRPDGTLYSEKLGLVGGSGPVAEAAVGGTSSAAPALLRVGRDYLGIVIEPGDPAGTYTVEAVVRDLVGRVELKLKTEFQVESAPGAAAAAK
jgi:hypothetical protein